MCPSSAVRSFFLCRAHEQSLSAVHRLIKRIHHLRMFVTAALHALTHAQEQQLLATLKKSQDNQTVA